MNQFNIPEAVMRYRTLETYGGESMIREVRMQYADMANGGDGGMYFNGGYEDKSCRQHNYPDTPDSFFQEVCDLLGWQWQAPQ